LSLGKKERPHITRITPEAFKAAKLDERSRERAPITQLSCLIYLFALIAVICDREIGW